MILACAIAALAAVVPLATSAPAATPAPAAHAAATPGGSGWTATASQFEGQDGTQFDFTCPSFGTLSTGVIGTDVYADTSSVCLAAVHVGLITLWGGGTVTIEIRPAEAAGYTGSTRNRITSSSAASAGGSFVVISAIAANPGIGQGGTGWSASASPFTQYYGAQFLFKCPKGGTPGAVYGTDTYTSFSSVCTAAVHAGLITLEKGGSVTIEMRPGLSKYTGSTQHGITSKDYPQSSSSTAFVIVGADDNAPPSGVATGDVTVNGRPFTAGIINYNSTVDVSRGTLTLSAPTVGTILTFGGGGVVSRYTLKKEVQKVGKRKRITASLNLAGGNFGQCGAFRAFMSKSQNVVRQLWANGKGRYKTKGRFSSASIRGTKWNTVDRCDGTLTQVTEGQVAVDDFAKKKTVIVKAGSQYLAQG